MVTIVANLKDRENALIRHVRGLAPNLVKEYLCEFLSGVDDRTIDLFVITMRAQSAVPAKTFAEVDRAGDKRVTVIEEPSADDEPEDEDEEEYLNDGECSI
jgi:hypothetical protein